MAGRSSTHARPERHLSISRRTSLKKPVANSALIACGRLVVGHGVADLDRQIAEYRARFGALNAFDANVLDDEGIEGASAGDAQQCRNQSPADQILLHAFSRK